MMKRIPLILFIFLLFCSFSRLTAGEKDVSILSKGKTANDSLLFSSLNLEFPGLEDVKIYYNNGDFEKAKSAYLKFRREKSHVLWSINPADRPKKPISTSYPAADKIMKHLIEASMNAPEAFLGEDINWEYNPVDPSKPYFTKEWSWCNVNRMPFWNTLGKAYWSTLDEKYAKEWVAQMEDWVEDNPVPLEEDAGATLCWRTIESGIRMAGSWMNAYSYFLNSPSFTPEAHALFVKGIIEHGERLEKITLDFPERGGNWITMECNGLGTIGILFPELKDSKKYIEVAFDRLTRELSRQVYPDGAQTELTPGYHQVSRSNFMQLAKLAQMNHVGVPVGYFDRLKKMYEYNLYLMDPSGNLPPFNDAGPTKTASSLMEAYDIWKDGKFLFGATLGKEGVYPGFDSYYFRYAGYYVMRSGWKQSDNCLYFDAGPVGSGHQHEDMLNLYLYSKGKILLTEPGTYSYDLSLWRRYILSTPSHNTIMVDGKEQHRADIPECCLIKEPYKNPWVNSPLFDYGSGTYSSGYQKNEYRAVQYMPKEYVGEKDTSVTHTRHVVFLKPYYYVVVDFLDGSGEHTYDAHFHLDAPDASVDQKSMSVRTLRKDTVQLGLYPMDTDYLKVRIVKGQENPILGWLPYDKRPIPTVVYSKKEEAPAVFSTLLYPYYGKAPKVSYTSIETNSKNLWGENINTPFESISLLIKRKDEMETVNFKTGNVPDFKTDAKVVVIRRPKNKNLSQFGFYGMSKFSDQTLSLTLDNPSSILILKEADRKLSIYNSGEHAVEAVFSYPLDKKIILLPKKWYSISSSTIKETLNNTYEK